MAELTPDATPQAPGPDAFARAVVFGACGFLGREVTRQLLAAGTRVLGIDTKPWPGGRPKGYGHSGKGAAALDEAAAFLAQAREEDSPGCSVRRGAVFPVSRQPASAFFHLAGLADAGACQRDPALAKRLNVDLVAEALAALSGTGAAFIFPSTGIVYGDALTRPAREDDPLLPGAEYARGKIEAEALVRSACARGGLCGAIARLSNLYGPGGGENTVLGRILAQARRGEALHVWDESPVRDFLYVADAAEGLIRLGLSACALDRSEGTGASLTANLSTGVGTRVGQLIDLCAELFHTSRLPQEREPDPARPVSLLVLDNSRLVALTGWQPTTQLAQGLQHCF